VSRIDSPIWSLSTALPPERVKCLLSYDQFDAVVELITNSLAILNFVWESFEAARLKGCHRASFLLQVSSQAYDAFFNSPVGYRDQFARSKLQGENANRALLTKLQGRLLQFGMGRPLVSLELLRNSLEATDAKVWIYEREVEDHLGDDTPEILYAPWGRATSNGVGLRAPTGLKLEVKGGCLNRDGIECRDPYKASRSDDIHTAGYS
jgi:hypothetical protein